MFHEALVAQLAGIRYPAANSLALEQIFSSYEKLVVILKYLSIRRSDYIDLRRFANKP